MLDNLVEQRTVVTLYRAPPYLTVAADFNGSALLLRFISRQHQYIVAVTTNVNNDNTGKGPLIKSFFVGMAHLSGKTGLRKGLICSRNFHYCASLEWIVIGLPRILVPLENLLDPRVDQ